MLTATVRANVSFVIILAKQKPSYVLVNYFAVGTCTKKSRRDCRWIALRLAPYDLHPIRYNICILADPNTHTWYVTGSAGGVKERSQPWAQPEGCA